MALNVGSRIAHYDVTALIGEGGMGQVYQATDTKLNRHGRHHIPACSLTYRTTCSCVANQTLPLA